MDHCHVFHTDAVHRSYPISDAKGVCACLWHRDTMCYLDERQRLLSAADQRGFLLLLFLHDGSKGHQGGEGRAAHCTQHPRPEGIDGWHTHTHTLVSSAATRVWVSGQRLSQPLLTSSGVWMATCPPGFNKSLPLLHNSTEVKMLCWRL